MVQCFRVRCDARRLGCASQTHSRRGQDHLVQHVNDAIRGKHVRGDDVRLACALVGDRQGWADRESFTLDGLDRRVDRHVDFQHQPGNHVVGQHLGQQCGVGQQLRLGHAQLRQQRCKCGVGRSEHGVGPRSIERVHQTSGGDSFHQDAEVRVGNGRLHDGFVGRQEHLVDGMDDAVGGGDISLDDFAGAIAPIRDHQAGTDLVDLEKSAAHWIDRFAQRNRAAWDLPSHDVVLEHSGQQRLVGQQLVFGHTEFTEQRRKRVVGGRKHGVRARCGQGTRKSRLNQTTV
nr:hypothetical protein [uncultured bacterium]